MAVLGEGSGATRYTVGFNDGTKLMVRKVSLSGTATTLKTQTIALQQIAVRIVREGAALVFEWKVGDTWEKLHREAISADTPAVAGGLFLATEQPQSIRVGFDYAMLIDPSAVSPLKGNVRLSEIMYNPIGGDDYEYVELLNAGDSTVKLRDAQFDRGITYRFGNVTLAAGERIVVAKNRSSFLLRYGTKGIRLAAGQFEGRLKNGGETIALMDANGDSVFSVNYADGGAWPGRADGNGSSLEVIDPRLDLNNPANWNSSIRYQGTPGDEIGRASDGRHQRGAGALRLRRSRMPLNCTTLSQVAGRYRWMVPQRQRQQPAQIPHPGRHHHFAPGGYVVFYETVFPAREWRQRFFVEFRSRRRGLANRG